MHKHTPGPWKYNPHSLTGCVRGAAGEGIAIANGGAGVMHSNGHLIAAAPELLAALREVVAEADAYEAKHGPMRRPWVRLARAAIAKAEGRAPL